MKKRNSLLAAIIGVTTLSGLAASGDDTSDTSSVTSSDNGESSEYKINNIPLFRS